MFSESEQEEKPQLRGNLVVGNMIALPGFLLVKRV